MPFASDLLHIGHLQSTSPGVPNLDLSLAHSSSHEQAVRPVAAPNDWLSLGTGHGLARPESPPLREPGSSLKGKGPVLEHASLPGPSLPPASPSASPPPFERPPEGSSLSLGGPGQPTHTGASSGLKRKRPMEEEQAEQEHGNIGHIASSQVAASNLSPELASALQTLPRGIQAAINLEHPLAGDIIRVFTSPESVERREAALRAAVTGRKTRKGKGWSMIPRKRRPLAERAARYNIPESEIFSTDDLYEARKAKTRLHTFIKQGKLPRSALEAWSQPPSLSQIIGSHRNPKEIARMDRQLETHKELSEKKKAGRLASEPGSSAKGSQIGTQPPEH